MVTMELYSFDGGRSCCSLQDRKFSGCILETTYRTSLLGSSVSEKPIQVRAHSFEDRREVEIIYRLNSLQALETVREGFPRNVS